MPTAPPAGVGSSWTWRPTEFGAAAAVGGPDGWIVAGSVDSPSGTSVPALWASTDGVAWQAHELPLPLGTVGGGAYRLGHGPAGLVAAGDVLREDGGGKVLSAAWRSADGRSWEVVGGELIDLGPCDSGCPTLMSVATDGTTVVVTGYRVTPDGDIEADAWTASGPDPWHQTALPAGAGGVRVAAETSVTVTDAGFNIAGSICDADGVNCRAVTWTSKDGAAWGAPTALPGGTGCGALRVIVGGTNLVVLGQRCVAGCKLTAWTSPDGASWSKGDLDVAKVTSPERGLIAFAGGRFLVAGWRSGRVEFWSSPNGAAWRKVPQSGTPFPALEETLFNDLAGRPDAALAIGWGPATTPGVWTSP